jgi:hypothetical protein
MNPAELKWLDIFFGILAYEIQHGADGNLLSEQCDRWIYKHPVLARVVIGTIGGVIVLHLANLIPGAYDPVHRTKIASLRMRGIVVINERLVED